MEDCGMDEPLPTEQLVDPAGINNNNPSRMVPYASEQTAPTDFLCINVGGKSYRILHKTIQMRESRLGLLHQLSISDHQRRLVIADDFLTDSGEYCFERTSKGFDPIIYFYMTGNLHKPSDMCMDQFREELLFWGLVKEEMAPCCTPIVVNSDNATSACIHATDDDKKKNSVDFKGFFGASIRRRFWPVLEDPSSSGNAKTFSVLSMIFTFASVLGLILDSMSRFQVKRFDKARDYRHVQLVYLEYVCFGWFTLEYISRLMVTPEKLKFVKSASSLIDLFTLLPFYMVLCLRAFGIDAESLHNFTGPMLMVRAMRVLSVARVFKLNPYSSGQPALGDLMKRSKTMVYMYSMLLVQSIIFFSAMVYFLEKDAPDSKFTSIPVACWWGVVTMTTVGYGDMVPVTAAGKLVAALASVCGIFMLFLPISLISDKSAESTCSCDRPADGSRMTKRSRRRTQTRENLL
uniref:Uncharacterized protein n=1 Tax=Plectus sambesii TaxID=2011161 RepID=A0A914WWK5_9BILA